MDRLSELRAAAGLSETSAEPAAPRRLAGLGAATASAASRALASDDAAAHGVCAEIASHVEAMEGLVAELREAVLPTKLQQLSTQFDCEEQGCVRFIRKGKAVLATLRRGGAATTSEDSGDGEGLAQIRENFATHRDAEFKRLVQSYFTVRGQHREETQARARRQLLFAYPDAREEDLQEALLCPSLAAAAISRRVERGPESGVTLEAVLTELESKQGNLQLLEEGAKGLKLLFMQFDELVNQQDEALGEIETNIQKTLHNTEDAVVVLKEAATHKSSLDKMRCCCWTVLFVVLIVLGLWFCPSLSSSQKAAAPPQPAAIAATAPDGRQASARLQHEAAAPPHPSLLQAPLPPPPPRPEEKRRGQLGPRQRQQQLQQLLVLQRQREEQTQPSRREELRPQQGLSAVQVQLPPRHDAPEELMRQAMRVKTQEADDAANHGLRASTLQGDESQVLLRRAVSLTAHGAARRHAPLRSSLQLPAPA